LLNNNITMLGPGKHDAICTEVRERIGARGVILIFFGDTPEATGFSVQADLATLVRLPDTLESVAGQVRADLERGRL
jgi:hypothetical protein